MEAQTQLLPAYLRDLSGSEAAYVRQRARMWSVVKDAKYAWTKEPAADKSMFVLIEPREHSNTEFVVKVASHFFSALGHGLCIVHGSTNGAFMRAACKDIENVNFVELVGIDNLPIPMYNALLMGKDFWNGLTHENIVIFQTDVIFMHNGVYDDSDLMADFAARYDYIGAPWWNIDPFSGVILRPETKTKISGRIVNQAFVCETGPDCVGNGGLSFRKKSAMLRIIEELGSSDLAGTNEDVFFAVGCKRLGLRVPKRSVAMKYSIEMCLPSDLPKDQPWSMGVHRAWSYHPADVIDCLLGSSALLNPDRVGDDFVRL